MHCDLYHKIVKYRYTFSERLFHFETWHLAKVSVSGVLIQLIFLMIVTYPPLGFSICFLGFGKSPFSLSNVRFRLSGLYSMTFWQKLNLSTFTTGLEK